LFPRAAVGEKLQIVCELFAIFLASVSRDFKQSIELSRSYKIAFGWRRFIQHFHSRQLAQVSIIHCCFENVAKHHQVEVRCSLRNRLQLAAAKNSAFQPLVEISGNGGSSDLIDSHVAEIIAPALDCLAFIFQRARPFALHFCFLKIARDVIGKERFAAGAGKVILASLVSLDLERLARG
jgi:hypothetical protein